MCGWTEEWINGQMKRWLNRSHHYSFGVELRGTCCSFAKGASRFEGPFGLEGCCVQRLCDHPAPTCNPEKGASFLPGCCLSLLSFLSRSRKHCHPGLCCAPPAFLFLSRELASSSPGQQRPGPQGCSRAVEAGTRQGSARPECTPPLPCAVSSPGATFQPWVTETLVSGSRDCGAATPRAKLACSGGFKQVVRKSSGRLSAEHWPDHRHLT